MLCCDYISRSLEGRARALINALDAKFCEDINCTHTSKPNADTLPLVIMTSAN